jgi:hypothetical protein
MAELFVWMVKEADGREGPVATIIPALGPSPVVLATGRLDLAERMGLYAAMHADNSGLPVRLVRFAEAETLKRL